MKININKIQYYRENPLAFLEEIYNIKLLPYQKYYLNKIWKENKIWNSEVTALILKKYLEGKIRKMPKTKKELT